MLPLMWPRMEINNLYYIWVLYKFVNFNSTLVIWLKFACIEMLDTLITYIVCWYKTLQRTTLRQYSITTVCWCNIYHIPCIRQATFFILKGKLTYCSINTFISIILTLISKLLINVSLSLQGIWLWFVNHFCSRR
jgi:hypothetical protein